MTPNVLNHEMLQLSEGSYFEIFKMLAKYDNGMIKEQVNAQTKEGISFFNKFIASGIKKIDQVEFFNFCENFGYNLGEEYSQNIYMKIYQKKEKAKIPEYIAILNNHMCTDDLAVFLTEKIGQKNLQELDKDWALLNYSFSKNWPKTIRLYDSYDIKEYSIKGNKKTILEIIGSDANLLNIYWNLNKEKNNESLNEEFENDLNHIFKQANNITTINDSVAVQRIVEYLKIRFPSWNQLQKEQVILKLLPSKTVSLLTEGLKLLGSNFPKYKSEEYPLWSGVGTLQSHHLLVKFLGAKIPLDSYSKKSNTYFIEEIIKAIQKIEIKIVIPDKSSMFTFDNQDEINKKVTDILKKIPKGFWLTNVPNKEETWFNYLLKKNPLPSLFKLMNVPPNDAIFDTSEKLDIINQDNEFIVKSPIYQSQNHNKKILWDYKEFPLENEQIKVIREILERTWLNKNEINRYGFEQNILALKMVQENTLFSNYYLKKEIETPFLYAEEKERLMQILISTDTIPIPNKNNCFISELYNNMKEDNTIVWKNIKISETISNTLKNTEMLFEIKARQMVETLQQTLPAKKDIKINKKKI